MTKYRTQEEREEANRELNNKYSERYRNNPLNRPTINARKRRWYHNRKQEKEAAKQAKIEELKKLSSKITNHLKPQP